MSIRVDDHFADVLTEPASAVEALTQLSQEHHRGAMLDTRCRYCGERWPCTTAVLVRWVRLLRAKEGRAA